MPIPDRMLDFLFVLQSFFQRETWVEMTAFLLPRNPFPKGTLIACLKTKELSDENWGSNQTLCIHAPLR